LSSWAKGGGGGAGFDGEGESERKRLLVERKKDYFLMGGGEERRRWHSVGRKAEKEGRSMTMPIKNDLIGHAEWGGGEGDG